MSELILHHYDLSPFSEKIRAMLGYTGLPWESVTLPEMPPRPSLDRLTGGYRRIPVAQIGADIFCDSRIIASEIARMSDKPELSLEACDPEVRAFANRADSEFFLACAAITFNRGFFRKLFKMMSLLDVGRLIWDRINMARASALKTIGGEEAKNVARDHLAQMEKMLAGDFLFGDEPSIADFAAYHGLWFIRDVAELDFVRGYPGVIAWMDRIKAFGNGSRTEVSVAQANQIARDQEARPLSGDNLNGQWIGQPVSIAPADYGQVPVKGLLAGDLADSWVLQRRMIGDSTVNVHFPKQGFALQTGMT
jgi:glutathione S-transferase